jgi:hypothetical protein
MINIVYNKVLQIINHQLNTINRNWPYIWTALTINSLSKFIIKFVSKYHFMLLFYKSLKLWNWIFKALTSWPLLVESLRTGFGFLPNLLIELALRISSSVVLLIGIVPSGHASPESVHSWNLSLTFIPFL